MNAVRVGTSRGCGGSVAAGRHSSMLVISSSTERVRRVRGASTPVEPPPAAKSTMSSSRAWPATLLRHDGLRIQAEARSS